MKNDTSFWTIIPHLHEEQAQGIQTREAPPPGGEGWAGSLAWFICTEAAPEGSQFAQGVQATVWIYLDHENLPRAAKFYNHWVWGASTRVKWKASWVSEFHFLWMAKPAYPGAHSLLTCLAAFCCFFLLLMQDHFGTKQLCWGPAL